MYKRQVPDVLDTKVYDEIITVTNADAFATGRLIGHKAGVLVGISSGAAVWAALELEMCIRDRCTTYCPGGDARRT